MQTKERRRLLNDVVTGNKTKFLNTVKTHTLILHGFRRRLLEVKKEHNYSRSQYAPSGSLVVKKSMVPEYREKKKCTRYLLCKKNVNIRHTEYLLKYKVF